jgi:hypothetical protein
MRGEIQTEIASLKTNQPRDHGAFSIHGTFEMYFSAGTVSSKIFHQWLGNHGAPKSCTPTGFAQRRHFNKIRNFISPWSTQSFKVIFQDAWLGNGW